MKRGSVISIVTIILVFTFFTLLVMSYREPYGCPYGTQGDWCNTCQDVRCGGQWQCETGQQHCTHDPLFGDSCTNLWGDCQNLPVCPRDRVNMKNCGGVIRCCNDGQSCEDCVNM